MDAHRRLAVAGRTHQRVATLMLLTASLTGCVVAVQFERAPRTGRYPALPANSAIANAARVSDLPQPASVLGELRLRPTRQPSPQSKAEDELLEAAGRYGCDAIAEAEELRVDSSGRRADGTADRDYQWVAKCVRTPKAEVAALSAGAPPVIDNSPAERERLRLAAEAERARKDAERAAAVAAEMEQAAKAAAEAADKDRQRQAQALAELERKKREADDLRARQEAEARVRQEMEAKARREADDKARRDAEDRAKREAEAKAKREADEKARREAEARAKREAEEKARREAEAKAKREAEEKARREAEEKARREAEERARKKREADEQARREIEERVRREVEEKARREVQERVQREMAERERREADAEKRQGAAPARDAGAKKEPPPKKEPATKPAPAADRGKREAEERAKRDAEDKARREAEDRAKRDAEDKARREADERAKRDAEDRARRDAEERAKREADERREAEEKARRDADERREAEERAKREAAAKEAAKDAGKDAKKGAKGKPAVDWRPRYEQALREDTEAAWLDALTIIPEGEDADAAYARLQKAARARANLWLSADPAQVSSEETEAPAPSDAAQVRRELADAAATTPRFTMPREVSVAWTLKNPTRIPVVAEVRIGNERLWRQLDGGAQVKGTWRGACVPLQPPLRNKVGLVLQYAYNCDLSKARPQLASLRPLKRELAIDKRAGDDDPSLETVAKVWQAVPSTRLSDLHMAAIEDVMRKRSDEFSQMLIRTTPQDRVVGGKPVIAKVDLRSSINRDVTVIFDPGTGRDERLQVPRRGMAEIRLEVPVLADGRVAEPKVKALLPKIRSVDWLVGDWSWQGVHFVILPGDKGLLAFAIEPPAGENLPPRVWPLPVEAGASEVVIQGDWPGALALALFADKTPASCDRQCAMTMRIRLSDQDQFVAGAGRVLAVEVDVGGRKGSFKLNTDY